MTLYSLLDLPLKPTERLPSSSGQLLQQRLYAPRITAHAQRHTVGSRPLRSTAVYNQLALPLRGRLVACALFITQRDNPTLQQPTRL